jgi:hypothetical protein
MKASDVSDRLASAITRAQALRLKNLAEGPKGTRRT